MRPGQRWEQQKLGLNRPRILEPPKSVGELNFSPRMFFSAERTVHEQNGESITAFWRVHWQVLESTFLVRKDCPRNLRVPPCISDADRFAVFRGVHSCLHGSACVLFQINMRKRKHRFFVLCNLVPIRGAVSWQSVCELPRVRFLLGGIQHTESGIAGGLDPESVNLFWGV